MGRISWQINGDQRLTNSEPVTHSTEPIDLSELGSEQFNLPLDPEIPPPWKPCSTWKHYLHSFEGSASTAPKLRETQK